MSKHYLGIEKAWYGLRILELHYLYTTATCADVTSPATPVETFRNGTLIRKVLSREMMLLRIHAIVSHT